MADPVTTNIALAIPTRGSDVGVWDVPVNGDFNAIDGFFGGVQTISTSNANIVLTAPAGSITPSGGPTQAQNCVLRFTGVLTGNVQVTLPLPGRMCIENLTSGNFVLSFAAAASGNVIAIDQGEVQDIENDGTNVKFVNLGRPSKMEFWAGISAMPAWVTACTVPPYLLCDGSVYNYSAYPYLGPKLAGSFGGNGITTFGVPDMQGRVPLAYDGTGTRITTGGSGINGQTIGAAGGAQTETLITSNLPPYTPSGSVSTGFNFTPSIVPNGSGFAGSAAPSGQPFYSSGQYQILTVSSSFFGSAQGGTSKPVVTVQPSQVTGIWVIKT